MKKNYNLLLIALLVLFTYSVNAQTTLSHSTTTNITPANTVSCNSGLPDLITFDNIYYRSWDIAALGYSQFDVTEVQFGVELVVNESPGFAVDVVIYSNSGGPFPAGTLTPVATVSVPLTAADSGTLKTVPIVASVFAPNELVFGISVPDEDDAGNATSCFMGSNADGQSAPTYLSSDACSIFSPTDMANLGQGFPNVHLVASVTGSPTLSLNDLEMSQVSVSPNPTKDIVNIKLHPSNTIKSVDLFNITGQLVYKAQNQTEIDMSNFNAGVYLMDIATNNGKTTKRIVKQ